MTASPSFPNLPLAYSGHWASLCASPSFGLPPDRAPHNERPLIPLSPHPPPLDACAPLPAVSANVLKPCTTYRPNSLAPCLYPPTELAPYAAFSPARSLTMTRRPFYAPLPALPPWLLARPGLHPIPTLTFQPLFAPAFTQDIALAPKPAHNVWLLMPYLRPQPILYLAPPSHFPLPLTPASEHG